MTARSSSLPTEPAGDVALTWPAGPDEVRLADDEIHVWCAALDECDATERHQSRAVLSVDERVRASKFHRARDRDRFIARRGILRVLLGRYLQQNAATIRFYPGHFGKPEIARPDGHRALHFNGSHSGELAVYAVTWACPLGIDVERQRPIQDLEGIGSRFFGPAEVRRLMALPPDQRLDEFFACWTHREAYLKATGEGIGEKVATTPFGDWRIQRLAPSPGYVGAIAYRLDTARLSLWSVSRLRARPARWDARDHAESVTP